MVCLAQHTDRKTDVACRPTKTGQVFLVLATNTLAQLRDKIHCHADISMVSVHGSLAPSSLFYMEVGPWLHVTPQGTYGATPVKDGHSW